MLSDLGPGPVGGGRCHIGLVRAGSSPLWSDGGHGVPGFIGTLPLVSVGHHRRSSGVAGAVAHGFGGPVGRGRAARRPARKYSSPVGNSVRIYAGNRLAVQTGHGATAHRGSVRGLADRGGICGRAILSSALSRSNKIFGYLTCWDAGPTNSPMQKLGFRRLTPLTGRPTGSGCSRPGGRERPVTSDSQSCIVASMVSLRPGRTF
jgi:hypothetical protein